MVVVSVDIRRAPEACWRAFLDPDVMLRWVPGLREVRLISLDRAGRPEELLFEFAGDLVYSLEYGYDPRALVVRWQPRPGEAAAVRGFARFDAGEEPDTTRFTYALEHDPGRKAAERALDDPRVLAAAFARFMHEAGGPAP